MPEFRFNTFGPEYSGAVPCLKRDGKTLWRKRGTGETIAHRVINGKAVCKRDLNKIGHTIAGQAWVPFDGAISCANCRKVEPAKHEPREQAAPVRVREDHPSKLLRGGLTIPDDNPGVLRSDTAVTQARYERLEAYMATNVLGANALCCSSESSVAARALDTTSQEGSSLTSAATTMPSWETLHSASLSFQMDTGGPNGGVSLDQRRSEVYACAALPFTRRNPHMRGTTLALRPVFGRDQWDDNGDEFLSMDRRSIHLFDAFAMANLRLCSAVDLGSTSSKGTRTMSQNCLRHLKATIEILNPTIVIVQGAEVGRSLRGLVLDSIRLTANLELVTLAGNPVLLASFAHPSYPATAYNWSGPSRPYFESTVLPTLREARRESLLARTVDQAE